MQPYAVHEKLKYTTYK